MHVLLTGASSFIGGNITRKLLAAGLTVTGTYRRPSAVIESLRSSASMASLELVQLDLVEEGAYARLPRKVDHIIHIAGASSMEGVAAADIVACNVLGTGNLIRYALRAGASRCIYASSLSVHGRIEDSIVDEKTPMRDPDVYGATKYLGERLLASVAGELPAIGVRLPGVLGPGAHRAWLPTILAKIRSGGDITVHSPEAAFNNAVYIDDLAAFFLSLIGGQWTGFHAFPIGAAGSTTIRGAVERLLAAEGVSRRITVRRASHPGFTISSEYARGTFGYSPLPIEVMLDRYVKESAGIEN